MGSPSRNVQYHPPRLSEDRLNLPQPHSPSLPTHCSGKSGMRPMSTRTRCLTPALLASIARRLIRRGESCHMINVANGRVMLHEASWWQVTGAVRPPWQYQVTLTGPSTTESAWVSSEQVAHCMYSFSEQRPWYGVSPMGWSSSTVRLIERLERSIGDEAGSPTGHIFPVPENHGGNEDDDGDPLTALRNDLARLRGGIAMLETVARGYGDAAGAPHSDWRSHRFGPNVPESSATLREQASMSVYSACGVPADLVMPGGDTGQREGFRRWMHLSLMPLADLVVGELRVKLGVPDLAFPFERLRASDIASKARAWRSLVGKNATMPDVDARRLAGL